MNTTLVRSKHRFACALFCFLGICGSFGADVPRAQDAAEPPPASPPPAEAVLPLAHLIRVPLPITGEVDSRLKAMIEALLPTWQGAVERPILILEFGTREKPAGSGSQFERALSLARYLAGDALRRVRTVAYVSGSVTGHAVLPVLACEEIIVHPEAELGSAGRDEPFIDATVQRGYVEIAERRRTVPVPVVLAMLRGQEALYKVQTLEGVRYVTETELPGVTKDTAIRAVDQVVPAGQMALFSGTELRLKLGCASHLARDRAALAGALRLPVTAIEEDPSLGAGRRGLQVSLTGPISAEKVAWVEASLRQKIERDRVNFVCLVLDSPGGALPESVRLATYLADLDPGQVRTVAFVGTEARADAALIAWACDQLVMTETAVLGGPGARRISPRQLTDARVPLREIAAAKHRGWSLPAALLDPDLAVRRYTHRQTGVVQSFCAEELAEQKPADVWLAGDTLEIQAGVQGREAVDLQLARTLVTDLDELQRLYHFEEGWELAEPGWAHMLVQYLASPQIAGVLLFVAWFALMFEFMSPGLSGAGLVSGLCFLLFFWANFLQGNAEWLEIVLFVAGVLCVTIELFALPGFGVFGIAGALLVVASIVLASQTFVVPGNAYQWSRLPTSLFMVAAGGTGAVAAMILMRRAVSRAPVFRRVALEPPDTARREQLLQQEALVHWEHLLGQRGVTVTQLTPCGKARFGDQLVDVLSEGDAIPAGTPIAVVEVQGNEVVVRATQ